MSQKMKEHEDYYMRDYDSKKDKMDSYLENFDKHYSPKIKKR